MAKYPNLARMLSVLIFSIVCVKASIGQTSYYVDPAFAGTSRNGSASAPWQSLSDSWSLVGDQHGAGKWKCDGIFLRYWLLHNSGGTRRSNQHLYQCADA